jgi:hypothetical protein
MKVLNGIVVAATAVVAATFGLLTPSAATAADDTALRAQSLDVIGNPPPARVNEPYSYTFTAVGPDGTRLMPASNLPPGLRFDYDTGVLSGTPTAPRPQTHEFGITAYYSENPNEWPDEATRYFQLPYETSRNYTEIGVSDSQHKYSFEPFETKEGINLWCPARQPYLIKQQISTGRIVPKGVQVLERGFGAGDTYAVFMSSGTHEKNGFQAGIKDLHMYNSHGWDRGTVTVTLHCTNNEDEAARIGQL